MSEIDMAVIKPEVCYFFVPSFFFFLIHIVQRLKFYFMSYHLGFYLVCLIFIC